MGLAQFSLLEISPVFSPSDSPKKWYQSRWFTAWVTLYRKSSWWRFQVSVSCISIWTTIQVRGHLLPLKGECINVKEGLSLEGEIVRYSSVSLSHTLSRNEKVEQHIKKKTHKPIALRFWVGGGVIPCGVTHFFILVCLPKVSPLDSYNIWLNRINLEI